jgi:hypothetical protein
MDLREIVLVTHEIHAEGGRRLGVPTRRVAACATLANPHAGRALDDHGPLVARSAEVGAILAARAREAMAGAAITGYGKGAIVGTAGDLEQGAAMIHVRLGLPMREAIGRGLALIPGNAKVAPAGSAIDIVLGGIDDGWAYDAMDTMTVAVPGSPRPEEILLIVAYAGPRPNARLVGNPPERVKELVERMRRGG